MSGKGKMHLRQKIDRGCIDQGISTGLSGRVEQMSTWTLKERLGAKETVEGRHCAVGLFDRYMGGEVVHMPSQTPLL